MLFEYHCFESDESADAELWHHSHSLVRVLRMTERGGGATPEIRAANAMPRLYRVRFLDDYEHDVFEDELCGSTVDYYRPDPLGRN